MSSINFFPGMPRLTYEVKARLEHDLPEATLLLTREPAGSSGHESYRVSAGGNVIGRYTIRRHGEQYVERNFFCIVPEGSGVLGIVVEQGTFGCGGTRQEDALRILLEHLQVAAIHLLPAVLRWPRRPAAAHIRRDR